MMTQKPNHKKPKRVGYKKLTLRTVKVTEEEYYRAEDRWYRFWNHEKYDIEDFHRFLKTPTKWWCDVGYIAVTPTAARKIAFLNGPHYHAILMAYKSKNLLQK